MSISNSKTNKVFINLIPSGACCRPAQVRLEGERVLAVRGRGGQGAVLAGQVGHRPEPVEQWEAASVSCQGQFVSSSSSPCIKWPNITCAQYLDVLTGGSKSVRFFLPLCGKAGDLVYLYNEGDWTSASVGYSMCYYYSNNIRSHCYWGRRCSLRRGAIFPGEQAGVWEGLSSLCCPRQKWNIWLIFYNVQVSLPEIRGWKYNVNIEIQKLRVANIYCVFFRQKITGCVSTLVISSASPPRWLARWTPCTTGEPSQAETGLSPWGLQLTIIPPRGALEAVNVGDRQGYVKLMQSLLGKDFRCRIMIIFSKHD